MSESAVVQARPWEEPIWKPAAGKAGILLYLVVVHVLAVVGLILFPVPHPLVFGLALAMALLGGLGTTAVFHRCLAHRTVKLNKAVEHFLIFWTMFNGSGSPLSWVANHRHHHLRSDTDEDISSPHHGGFWWAHLRWLYQAPRPEAQRWAPEMDHAEYRFWERVETPVMALALLSGAALGWEGFFWMGAIRMVYSLHMQCFVNSLTHLGPAREGDHSQNVWWLGPLQMAAWGENWHRNHHDYAGSARFGVRWWQVDVGWYFIYAMERLGLASDVRARRPQSLAA